MRRALCAMLLLAAPLAAGPWDGVTEYARGLARSGDARELEAMVQALERANAPDTAAKRELVRALERGLPARFRSRLHALPAPSPVRRDAAAFVFPRDHGAHLSSLLEWWYFNGHLTAGGRRYAYMVTFFKTLPRLHFAHVALTDLDSGQHWFHRAFQRPFDVRMSARRMDVRFGRDEVRELPSGVLELTFALQGRKVALRLDPTREAMPVNGDGVIDMPEGTTSRYYSLSRLTTTGTLTDATGNHAITGQSWFDHQWGNFIALFRPWDWFCLQLEDGTDYNIFHFRDALGFPGRTCVTRLDARGRLTFTQDVSLARRAFWTSPRTGDRFVTRWDVELRGLGERVTLTAQADDQEMPRRGWWDFPPAYWEGAMDVTVTRPDAPARRGVGFCEHFPHP